MPESHMNRASRSPLVQTLLVRLSASRFVTTSLLIHLALIVLVGGVVVFKSGQQTDFFLGSESGILTEEVDEDTADAPEPVQEFEEPSEGNSSSSEASAVSPASAISSLTSGSNFSITAPSDQQLLGNNISVTERKLTTGSGMGTGNRGSGSTGGKLRGTLFGVKIETRKLGIMLDVSGSAHPYLLEVFEEVDKSFKFMPTILLFGCGAKDGIEPHAFSMKEAARAERDFEKNQNVEETVFGQVANALKNPDLKDLAKYMERMLNRKQVYWSVNDEGVNPRFGTNLAMKFLMDQDADTIYWFSDLEDPFDTKVAEEIGTKLKQKGVRVIAHNFTGIAHKQGEKAAQIIVDLTGGELITRRLEDK